LGREDRHDVNYGTDFTNKTQFGQINFGPRYLIGRRALDQSGLANVGLEVYGGGRVNYVSNSLNGTATISNVSSGFDVSASRWYAEPMIGIKTIWKIGPNFVAIIRGDVGGFNLVENNTDCDLEAAIAWQIQKNTFIDLAYRARGQWQTESKDNITVQGWFSGPEIGMTFGF